MALRVCAGPIIERKNRSSNVAWSQRANRLPPGAFGIPFIATPIVCAPTVGSLATELRRLPMSDPVDSTDPLALEQQVCFALSVAARSVVAVYRPLLEPMGLTHP